MKSKCENNVVVWVTKRGVVSVLTSIEESAVKSYRFYQRKPTNFHRFKQAGTGPRRRHIQGSKIAKGLPSVNLVLEDWKPKKMDRVARRGPLARASGALKGGHFRNCQHFCRS